MLGQLLLRADVRGGTSNKDSPELQQHDLYGMGDMEWMQEASKNEVVRKYPLRTPHKRPCHLQKHYNQVTAADSPRPISSEQILKQQERRSLQRRCEDAMPTRYLSRWRAWKRRHPQLTSHPPAPWAQCLPGCDLRLTGGRSHGMHPRCEYACCCKRLRQPQPSPCKDRRPRRVSPA